MTKKVKRIGCSFFKDLIEARKLILHDANTILEVSCFEARGESYEAANGSHDDLVMNMILLSWFLTTPLAELKDGELKDMLFAEKAQAMEDDLVPAGYLGNSATSRTPSMEIHSEMVGQMMAWNNL
jgi:hypothetical protein